MSPLFLDIMSSYFSHSLLKACWVLGEMFLSSSKIFLCTRDFCWGFQEVILLLHEWALKELIQFFLAFSLWYPVSWKVFLQLFHSADFQYFSFTAVLFLQRPLRDPLGDVDVHGG